MDIKRNYKNNLIEDKKDFLQNSIKEIREFCEGKDLALKIQLKEKCNVTKSCLFN